MAAESDRLRRFIPIVTLRRGEGDEYEYGIYHADRDHAREVGDPLLAVVRAKTAAEARILAREYSQVSVEVIAVTDNLQVGRLCESSFSFRSEHPVTEESLREHPLLLNREARLRRVR